MPTYAQWNCALVEHFTAHALPRTPVRLCVDDDTLADIFVARLGQPPPTGEQATDDFRQAVRGQCVHGSFVYPPPAEIDVNTRQPRAAAFLAGMVYAAFRMVDDDNASEHNFFTRVREFLGLPTDVGGRPFGLGGEREPWRNGLPPEAKLWSNWNHWLRGRGWLPTATHGDTQFSKWTNFPISQTLLRDGDRQRVTALLVAEHQTGLLRPDADPDHTAVFLRRSVRRLPKHLRTVVRRENPLDADRFEAVVEQVHELALAVMANPTAPASAAGATAVKGDRVYAGLYRHEDAVAGTREYRVFPRRPRGMSGEPVRVEWDGAPRELKPLGDRWPHWFRWLGPVPLNQTFQLPVVGHPRLRHLVLPRSDFWVFVPDPTGGSGWATWQRPELGKKFLLLCRPLHASHLDAFRKAEVFDWDCVQTVSVFGEEWREYHGCRITAANWSEVPRDASSRDLHAALEPVGRVSIHLAGGLAAPDGVGWMRGCPPAVWVCAFEDEVTFRLQSLLDTTTLHEWTVTPNTPEQPQPLPEGLLAGPYILSAHRNNQRLNERVVEVRDWAELVAVVPEDDYPVALAGHRLCGADVTPND